MITARSWTPEISDFIRVSAGRDLAFISEQVRSGVAQLWRCESSTGSGHVVTRVEQVSTGDELVIVCGEGTGAAEFGIQFFQEAKRQGMSVRTHVKRKGLVKIWENLGMSVDQIIMRG